MKPSQLRMTFFLWLTFLVSSQALRRNPFSFPQKRKQTLTCNALCFFLIALFWLACFCTEEKASEKASSPTNFLSSSMISWERFFSVGSNKTKITCLIFFSIWNESQEPGRIPRSLLKDDCTDSPFPIYCRDQSKGACEICWFFTSFPRGPQVVVLHTGKQKSNASEKQHFFQEDGGISEVIKSSLLYTATKALLE